MSITPDEAADADAGLIADSSPATVDRQPTLANIAQRAGRRLEAAQKMADALQHTKRRLQMDINDGSRPDQWSMEDLVRTIDKAADAWEQSK